MTNPHSTLLADNEFKQITGSNQTACRLTDDEEHTV